jgi:hypothetical protein
MAKAFENASAKRYKRLSKTMTLVDIGLSEKPAISRQRVRQLIKSIE